MTARKTIATLLILSAGLGALAFGVSHLVWVLTGSVQPTLLWRTADSIERGNYVLFTLISPLDHKAYRLTKKLVCQGGDQLTYQHRHFLCNGLDLGSVPRGPTYRTLPHFTFNGVIPPHKGFVMGDQHIETSFDSRYWGLIELTQATRLRPIM